MGRQQQRPAAKRDYNDFTDLRVGLYCRVSKADPNNSEREREKSTTDQEAVGRQWVERQGAVLADVYSDEGISASHFTRKERAEYNRMLADIEDCKLDVLWYWEQSRLSRRQTEYFQLVELCRDNGVIWVNRDRVIDPGDYKDTLAPGIMASIDAISSEQTSERVRRGLESIALAGRPTAGTTYGYRRIYDPITRKLVRQEPDTFDGDGTAVEDSPAAVVREIFERIAAGDSANSIRHDLDTRAVPPPRTAARWRHQTIVAIGQNPAYIARRVHQGKVLEGVKAVWPTLVDEDVFWTVQQILTAPERTTTRPSRAQSLLSHILRCAECGAKMQGAPRSGGRGRIYRCMDRVCANVNGPAMDSFVERVIVAWLSDPDVFAAVTAVDDSAAAAQARADADRARVDLEQWRRAAESGDITLASFTRAEKGALARIAEAEQRASNATVPSVLAGRIGPEAEAAWGRAPLEVKRQIIAAIADIRVCSVGAGRRIAPEDRIEWRWLLGPDAGRLAFEPVKLPDGEAVGRSEAKFIVALARAGSLQQRGLHELLGMKVSAAHNIMRRMLHRGWISRTLTPLSNSRPTFTLTLTEEGRQAAAALDAEVRVGVPDDEA